MPTPPHPNSVWRATAPPGPELPALAGDLAVDVAVVGAGCTGLAAVHHLRQAGIAAAVLEANEIGWGASGRNAGFLVPRYKKGFAAIAKQHGDVQARALHDFLHESIGLVEDLIERYGIDCDYRRCGQVIGAHSEAAMAGLASEVRWLEAHVGNSGARTLDREAMARETGTALYRGGFLDPRGAAFHPLKYVQGLVRGIASDGVPIYTRTPVIRIVEDAGTVALTTPGGTVRARHAVLATNAYSDLGLAGIDLARRVVPVAASAAATQPLSDNIARQIAPGGQMVSDTKRLMNWFRLLPDNRLMFGGRADLTGRRTDAAAFAGIDRWLATIFPELGPFEVAQRWTGLIAMTLDDFPGIGRLGERIHYALGCGGRGVPLMHALGRCLAERVQGLAGSAPLMGERELPVIPFHGLRRPAMEAMALWYRYKDATGV